VELLLTVALMLMLAGAVIFNFGAMDRNAGLEEGTIQVESLFRFARAQAESTGRRVKIILDNGTIPGGGSITSTNQVQTMVNTNQGIQDTNQGIQALWEPDPINFPGKFEPLPGAALLVEHVNDLVRVLWTRQPSAAENQTNGALTGAMLLQFQTAGTNFMTGTDGRTALMPPVICYPDGSSDSVGLVLGPVDHEDKRLMVVTLSGLTGVLRHRLVNFGSDGTATIDTTASSSATNADQSQDQ
jgi:type II secretory pathway pseudopilin PulG